jgi:hypothetical protein
MLLSAIIIIIMSLLGFAGIVLIHAGQYLYKEKFIKSGLREGLYNTSVNDYPENNDAKNLLIAGQICIGIDVLLVLLYLLFVCFH